MLYLVTDKDPAACYRSESAYNVAHTKERTAYDKAHPDQGRARSLSFYHRAKSANPEKVFLSQRRTWLKRNYGLTEGQYDQMMKDQNGVCAACSRPERGRKGYLHVDHDHRTGQVRGLLCQGCNMALGLAGESIEGLKALIKYLEKANEKAKETAA